MEPQGVVEPLHYISRYFPALSRLSFDHQSPWEGRFRLTNLCYFYGNIYDFPYTRTLIVFHPCTKQLTQVYHDHFSMRASCPLRSGVACIVGATLAVALLALPLEAISPASTATRVPTLASSAIFAPASCARRTDAPMKSRNSGCGRLGRLLNSGWNCEPTNQGWSANSMISTKLLSAERPLTTTPCVSMRLRYSLLNS